MKNLITTIPKSRFNSWAECEAELVASDGENGSFWTVAATCLPSAPSDDSAYPIGALMFIVFDGAVRGYLHCIDVDLAKRWPFHDGGKAQYCFVLANWRPIASVPLTGFQGWRYTALQP